MSDKTTGAPINLASVHISFIYSTPDGGEYNDIITTQTDITGKFQYAHESDFNSTYAEAQKSGYAIHPYLQIKRGEVNDFNIALIPLDAVLNLHVVNSSGAINPIYVAILNPSIASEYQNPGHGIPSKPYPIVLAPGAKHEDIYNLPSGEYTKVFWDLNDLYPNLLDTFHQDSVFLTKGDTTEFIINY